MPNQPIDEKVFNELMRSISHDLRNPLAAVVTNLAFSRGLIDDPTAIEDLTEAVDDSVIACDVMQMIVANLDIILKGDAPHPTLHSVTVSAVVADVIKRFRPRASQARVAINFEPPAESAKALLDRTYFALSVENIIANGVTHSPKNTSVDISVITEEDGTSVHFVDAGLVIPEELRDLAVSATAHTRAGRVEHTRYSRGLGLLCASRAATAAGASMHLSEHEGRNRFTLHIHNFGPLSRR